MKNKRILKYIVVLAASLPAIHLMCTWLVNGSFGIIAQGIYFMLYLATFAIIFTIAGLTVMLVFRVLKMRFCTKTI